MLRIGKQRQSVVALCVYTHSTEYGRFIAEKRANPTKQKVQRRSIYMAATCSNLYYSCQLQNAANLEFGAFSDIIERKGSAQLYMCSTQLSIDIQHCKVFRRHAGEISCFSF